MRSPIPSLATRAIVKIDEAGRVLAADHSARPKFWHGFVMLVTQLGSGVLWFPVYGLVWALWPRCSALPLTTLLCGEALGLLVLVPLRYGFQRPRPNPSHRSSPLVPWDRFSFPSHHSLRAFFIAVVLGQGSVVLLPWLLLLAAMIGLSRVLLQRHYLSDVLVGAMIGGGIGILCVQLAS